MFFSHYYYYYFIFPSLYRPGSRKTHIWCHTKVTIVIIIFMLYIILVRRVYDTVFFHGKKHKVLMYPFWTYGAIIIAGVCYITIIIFLRARNVVAHGRNTLRAGVTLSRPGDHGPAVAAAYVQCVPTNAHIATTVVFVAFRFGGLCGATIRGSTFQRTTWTNAFHWKYVIQIWGFRNFENYRNVYHGSVTVSKSFDLGVHGSGTLKA